MTAAGRTRRADAADALCAAAFARAVDAHAAGEETGLALVAVGGYGRRELAPHSDLDVVLVHTEEADPGEVATAVWYPLWDTGAAVDHAVRALPEVAAAAKQDVRVALGLLDARHLAGDPAVTMRLRSVLLAQWRREARARLPELHDMVRRRVERVGELAHSSVPDLKEAGGGLRDATILNALVATWLVDVPHGDLERARLQLLDVRDALHEVAGRGSDRIAPDMWEDLAQALGDPDAETTQRRVRMIGRRITHVSRLTWRRVEGALAPAPRRRRAGPVLEPIGHGLALVSGEVVLQPGADPARDPALLLRAAAEAAEREQALSPPTVARLVRDGASLPDPWPDEARDLLVRLLAAGPGLLPVWETLDETDALTRLLPEWERVRLLPHASVVHRFTVDRHLVETCIEASRLVRRVSRPDLLVVAALVHDIGKGTRQDHSIVGEKVASEIAGRLGFPADDVEVIAALVRWHLLLAETATTRDLDDPATVESVAERVPDPHTLDLLEVLTEADARATSPKAWTRWRAGLVRDLAARVRAAHRSDAPEPMPQWEPVVVRAGAGTVAGPGIAPVDVQVTVGEHGSEVTVVARDRVGLLADVAGMFGLHRVSIRSARAWTQEEHGVALGVSRWQVDDTHLDAAVLRERLAAILDGRVEVGDRLRRAAARDLDPSVAVRPEASRRATVLEVRVEDRPGVLHLVCRALADIGVAVRSAHVSTFGRRVVDVFYVQEESAGALSDDRAAEAAHAVRRALTDPVTLDA